MNGETNLSAMSYPQKKLYRSSGKEPCTSGYLVKLSTRQGKTQYNLVKLSRNEVKLSKQKFFQKNSIAFGSAPRRVAGS